MKNVSSRTGYWAIGLVVLLLSNAARAQFRELAARAPRSANAIVLLNVEKLKVSPMAVREGWGEKIENAFRDGLSRVPGSATKFVLASQLDFEFMKPTWEAAVVRFGRPMQIEAMVKLRGGMPDKIEGLASAALPNNVYAVQFDPTTLGALAPSNRQTAARWVRDMGSKTQLPLSPYLEKAAGYSDDAGSEIIMALDLDGAVYLERVFENLKQKKFLAEAKIDLRQAAKLIAGVQGVRVGVRIKDVPHAAIAVDFAEDVSMLEPVAKPLMLGALADNGMNIDDLEQFTVRVKGTEIALSGQLTIKGLRRLLSVVESPAPSEEAPAAPAKPEKTNPAVSAAQASRDYYRAVTGLFDDLKTDLREAKTLASNAVWFDRYARKIERMPILGVDPELLDYGGFVASQLRAASGSTRTMGIQTAQRQSQYQYVYGSNYSNVAGSYGNYGYSYVPRLEWVDPLAGARQQGAARREVKAEEKGIMATDVNQIRAQVAQATADIRRKMTERYQIEF